MKNNRTGQLQRTSLFAQSKYAIIKELLNFSAGKYSPTMGARNQVGIGLSYWPASLCSLAIQFQTQFLESIPRPIAGLKIPTQITDQ
jgi:hypothetical protein